MYTIMYVCYVSTLKGKEGCASIYIAEETEPSSTENLNLARKYFIDIHENTCCSKGRFSDMIHLHSYDSYHVGQIQSIPIPSHS